MRSALYRFTTIGALLVATAGCYEPSLRDCALTCATDADCARGQVCSGGDFCAATGTTCAAFESPIDALTVTTTDGTTAGADAPVAPPPDASVPTPDAPSTNATLVVSVKNKGEVQVVGVGTCMNDDQNSTKTCAYGVIAGAHLSAVASATAGGHPFVKWDDAQCHAQGSSCAFTAASATTIEAEFH